MTPCFKNWTSPSMTSFRSMRLLIQRVNFIRPKGFSSGDCHDDKDQNEVCRVLVGTRFGRPLFQRLILQSTSGKWTRIMCFLFECPSFVTMGHILSDPFGLARESISRGCAIDQLFPGLWYNLRITKLSIRSLRAQLTRLIYLASYPAQWNGKLRRQMRFFGGWRNL